MKVDDLKRLYDGDPRPTFLVDCEIQPATIWHANTASKDLDLLGCATQCLQSKAWVAFKEWWDPHNRSPITSQQHFTFAGAPWIKFMAFDRWRIVTIANHQIPDNTNFFADGPIASLARAVSLPEPLLDSIFNTNLRSPELRQHVQYVSRVDWGKTSIGSIDSWSPELTQLVTTVLLDARPTALLLGPEYVIIYNLAYARAIGPKHPRVLGQTVTSGWLEIASDIPAISERSVKTDFADVPEKEYHYMIEHEGHTEETFLTCSLVPLVCRIDGMLLERRVNALLRMGQLTGEAQEFEKFWPSILESVKPFEYDIPCAILYSTLEPDTASSMGSGRGGSRYCTLEGTLDYSDPHPAFPLTIDLEKDNRPLTRALNDCVKEAQPVVYCKRDGQLPEAYYQNLKTRAFGDKCEALIICPIQPFGKETNSGYFIIGLNTRRPYDQEYQEWIQVFSNLLGTSAASVSLHEEEVAHRKRGIAQAARDRAALNDELSASEFKLETLHDVAEKVGLGYFEYELDGKVKHANQAFFAQNGHLQDIPDAPPFTFADRLYSDNKEMAMERWDTLTKGIPCTFEMRWKRSPDSEDGTDTRDYLWVLSACVPMRSLNGTVIGISGCNTDVTAQKESARLAMIRSEAIERATATERRLAAVTELSPCGFFQLAPDLKMQYCNEKWFQLTGQPIVPYDAISWEHIILEEDYASVVQNTQKVIAEERTLSVKSVIGTMMDVSQLKWAEDLQKIRVQEALESKRQQENFIDMTSHEMRNPLSAMIQCADSISTSLMEMIRLAHQAVPSNLTPIRDGLLELMDGCTDAIDTIQACATHQKRIVDDILTLSKLDSKLVSISPMVIQPHTLLRDTRRMFRDEAQKAGVTLEMRAEDSIKNMGIDWAILDPSRVLQVLINLITNAVKFTQDQDVRKVEVIMGASSSAKKRDDVEYVPPDTIRGSFLDDEEWSEGEIFYLHFTVQDTGCGLTADHKAKLFLRFSQATPRTHVQYGGSGLGLFISRELTEMQGGNIGVGSNEHAGSIFSFYIKSRRAQAPPDAHLDFPPHQPAETLPKPESQTKLGCTIQVAGHGEEALEELKKTTHWKYPITETPSKLSVILMDIEMPVMDGLTCARRVRELQDEGEIVAHVPIIAVSANARREQVEEAISAGMDDAIGKPFRIVELMPKIRKLVDMG
ncbi:hypothetical protein K491DRAFT_713734 [Lophiostoma macrostomum CBS 122681]|uniref:Histidine kinase HHK15p n=1 Tax=Lophiostoma macrostomum CBS 122681 TaxID=1314788 RepID=A0A6A6TGI9_9PLEO|nr:hypothetical protein K491DRAFT_713734 [Lophiostoma macrostomum CBS 122681]